MSAPRVKNKENMEILRVLAVKTPRGIYIFPKVNTASKCFKYSSCPQRKYFAPTQTLVEPSVSDLYWTMALGIVDTVHRRLKYTSYSKYYRTYWEYFVTASTRSTNTINTNGRNTQSIPGTCSTRINTEPRDTSSTHTARKHEVPTVGLSGTYLAPSIESNSLWKVGVCTHATHEPAQTSRSSLRKNTQLVSIVRINSAW